MTSVHRAAAVAALIMLTAAAPSQQPAAPTPLGGRTDVDVDEAVYAMLQLSSRVSGTADVAASQVFELIEDPLLNLLVPVVVDVLISIVRDLIIKVIGEIISLILADVMPVPLASTLWPGIDTTGVTISDTVPVSDSAKAAMSGVESMMSVTSTTTTRTVTGFVSVDELVLPGDPPAEALFPDSPVGLHDGPGHTFKNGFAYEEAGAAWPDAFSPTSSHRSNNPTAASLLEVEIVGPCDGSHSKAACDAAGSSRQQVDRCTWCEHGPAGLPFGPDGAWLGDSTVAACVPCSQPRRVAAMRQAGFSCHRSARQCEESGGPPAEPSEPPRKAAPTKGTVVGTDGDEYPSEPSLPAPPQPPNEMAKQLADTLVGATAGPLAQRLELEIEPRLREGLEGVLTRGVLRAVPPALAAAVSGDVVPPLSAALERVLTTVTTKRLTALLTDALTETLVPSLTEAITRDPAADYQCAYCDKASVYCAGCAALRRADVLHAAWSYARAVEASRTYTGLYAGVLGEHVAHDALHEAAEAGR